MVEGTLAGALLVGYWDLAPGPVTVFSIVLWAVSCAADAIWELLYERLCLQVMAPCPVDDVGVCCLTKNGRK